MMNSGWGAAMPPGVAKPPGVGGGFQGPMMGTGGGAGNPHDWKGWQPPGGTSIPPSTSPVGPRSQSPFNQPGMTMSPGQWNAGGMGGQGMKPQMPGMGMGNVPTTGPIGPGYRPPSNGGLGGNIPTTDPVGQMPQMGVGGGAGNPYQWAPPAKGSGGGFQGPMMGTGGGAGNPHQWPNWKPPGSPLGNVPTTNPVRGGLLSQPMTRRF